MVAEGLGHPEPWVERWVTQVTHLRPGPSNRATPGFSAFPPDSLGLFEHIFPLWPPGAHGGEAWAVPGRWWHSREIDPSSGRQPVLLELVVAEHQHTEAAAAVQRALCHLLDDVGTQVQLLEPRLGVRGLLPGGLALLPAPSRPHPWYSDATVSGPLRAIVTCAKGPSNICQ